MRKFLVGLLMVIFLATSAVAGPIEKMFITKNYTKAVCDILTIDAAGANHYAQGLAIGPHYVLTAHHVVINAKQIRVCLQSFDKDGIRDWTFAKIVANGNRKRWDEDWAIIRTSKKMVYWISEDVVDAEVGDTLYNLSGRYLLEALIIPLTVISTEALPTFEVTSPQGRTLKVYEAIDVYMFVVHPVGGDSGSPIFNGKGELVAIATASTAREGIAVKGKKFKEAYEKYRGK